MQFETRDEMILRFKSNKEVKKNGTTLNTILLVFCLILLTLLAINFRELLNVHYKLHEEEPTISKIKINNSQKVDQSALPRQGIFMDTLLDENLANDATLAGQTNNLRQQPYQWNLNVEFQPNEDQIQYNFDLSANDNQKSQPILVQQEEEPLLTPDVEIVKPQIDKKEYKYLELPNGLKVMIVYDEKAQKAEAALNVHAGSWNDPQEYPGLAHFLEHMLFQGSVTYPQKGYFQRFVAEHGGNTNAYTQPTMTNYFFSIQTSQFKEALDVFAHFFIDPLFSEDMVEKEVQAVNSEFEIAVSGDAWKMVHILSLMTKSDHPMSRFTIGSTATLKKENIVSALKGFHERYYSSNLMALVVRSSVPLLEMQELLLGSAYARIPNKALSVPSWLDFGMPLPAASLGSIAKYHINKHSKILHFVYQLEDIAKHYAVKPLTFIDSLVTSKHKDGLYQNLIERGLIIEMATTLFQEGNGAFVFYLIVVQLPDKPNSESQANVIQQAITEYINEMISLFQDDATLLEMWTERKTMAEVTFRYLQDTPDSPNSDIFHLSHNLNTYNPGELLTANLLYKEYDASVIHDYLKALSQPTNSIILISSDIYQYSTKMESCERDIDFLRAKSISRRNDMYRLDWDVKKSNGQSVLLPTVNPYVPQGLTMASLCHSLPQAGSYVQEQSRTTTTTQDPYQFLVSDAIDDPLYAQRLDSFVQENQFYYATREECLLHERVYETQNPFPHLIKKDIEGKAWWKLDRSYEIPAIYAGVQFENAINMTSLKQSTLLQLYNAYVDQSLKEQLEQQINAGYKIEFSSSRSGISLQMFGWSDQFEKFYLDVLNALKVTAMDEQKFMRSKATLQSGYQDTYEDKLYKQALLVYLPATLMLEQYSSQDRSTQLTSLRSEDVLLFANDMLANFRYTTFFAGNVLREQADRLVSGIRDVFQETTSHIQINNQLLKVIDLRGRSITLPSISLSSDTKDQNAITLNYYQIGKRDRQTYAIMALLQGTLSNQAFEYLRTDRQLGYVVAAKFQPLGCVDGLAFLVQGTAKPPHEVNQHIENFLKYFAGQLRDMTADQFQSLKSGAISQLTEEIKSLLEQASFMWGHIKSNDLAFEEKQVAASIMQQITHEEVSEFFQKIVGSATETGKISIQIYGKGMVQGSMGSEHFQEYLSQKTIEQSYANQTEVIQFEALDIAQVYSCPYTITNI